MALSTRIQAACLLLLLLASVASGSVLPHKTGQLTDLRALDTAGAEAGLQPTLQLRRLRRRDTHFPICIFCCGCCKTPKCGFCCRT